MRIGIDASRYKHESATGVEFYSKHIIDGLIAEASKSGDEIILYSREKINFPHSEDLKISNKVLPAKRFWTIFTLSKEMLKSPPDVLFVPSHTLPFFPPKKCIITIHDVAFKHLRKAYSFFQYHHLNSSTKSAVKYAYKIIVPSEATKNDLKHFYKCDEKKIMVIPHGFSKPEFSAAQIDDVLKNSEIFKYFGITKMSDYILFVGRLESKKNLERIISAFKDFSEIHPHFKLILAGKRGVGFEKIWKIATEKKILEKIIMPGYITEDEKAAFFKYCRIFIFTSLYEGFGLPILEAFYYKKPVITSRTSSLPEVGGEGVHYVDPYDEMDILKALDKLVNDSKYADALSEKGEERLKLFSWKTAAKKTWEVLKS